jgi:hypothetical protein
MEICTGRGLDLHLQLIIPEDILIMAKNRKVLTNRFIANQLAGSCRLEGIRVTANDETQMLNILDGRVNPAILRRNLINKYRAQNKETLGLAVA